MKKLLVSFFLTIISLNVSIQGAEYFTQEQQTSPSPLYISLCGLETAIGIGSLIVGTRFAIGRLTNPAGTKQNSAMSFDPKRSLYLSPFSIFYAVQGDFKRVAIHQGIQALPMDITLLGTGTFLTFDGVRNIYKELLKSSRFRKWILSLKNKIS